MIGRSDRSWNSLDRVVAPALLASIEAAWLSTWVDALWHESRNTRVDTPFIAVALVAAVAVALASCLETLLRRDRLRRFVRVAVALVLAMVAAGLIGQLYVHGSFLVLSSHPWSASAGAESSGASAVWFVVTIAVARGTWLGSGALDRRRVMRSLSVAMLAFVVFFLAALTHRSDVALSRQVGVAEVLVLVGFPFAVAVVAVVSERDLERSSIQHQLSRPSVAWLGAVLLPMAVVAASAVGLAIGVRPLLQLLVRVARSAALWLVDVLDDVLGRIAAIIHLRSLAPVARREGAGRPAALRAAHAAPVWITSLAIVIAVVLVAVAATLTVRALRRLLRRRRRPPRPRRVQPLDEERDSVFSWSHLLDQLLAAIRRWRDRRIGVPFSATAPQAARQSDEAVASVRSHYRRMLRAAKGAGHPRSVVETPLELAARLAHLSDEAAVGSLSSLTDIYDAVRYGGHRETTDEIARAGTDSEAFATSLRGRSEDLPGDVES